MKHLSVSLVIFLLACLLSVSAISTQARVYHFDALADKHFTDAEYDSLFRQAAWEEAEYHHVPPQIFNSVYPTIKTQLVKEATPYILKSCRWMRSTGSSTYKASDKALYTKEFIKAISKAIYAHKSIGMPLLIIDQTDRILSFCSYIKVLKDGTLEVTEDITIYNGDGEQDAIYLEYFPDQTKINNQIKHGPYREFPTDYVSKHGFISHKSFEITGIYKNGKQEPYHTENLENGVRIYIGDAATYIDKGVFIYRITYTTGDQLIFHADKDELYWNVNGSGWQFTADSVSCTIEFPEGASVFEQSCYTGQQGSTAHKCTSREINPHTIFFATSDPLTDFEGLTVAASIQKGILQPPSASHNTLSFLKSNWVLSALGVLVLIILGLNYLSWYKHGRDPDKGTIIPQFEPPAGFTPSDIGFIFQQGYSSHLFGAALIDLAVNKEITIHVQKEGSLFKKNVYRISRAGGRKNIAARYGWDTSRLNGLEIKKGEYNPTVGDMNTALAGKLEEKWQQGGQTHNKKTGLFRWNSGYGVWGFFVLAAAAIAAIIILAHSVYAPMLIASVSALLLVGFIMQYIFYRIMPSYSREGRKVTDHIEGFKRYLETTEQRIYNTMTPPEKTLELFERYLPYAIGLKVENKWAEQFDSILKTAVANGSYAPTWYSDHLSRDRSVSEFSQSISDGLSNSISSASTEPSSSDSGGSSGGGSSGGGGGGGGGGGW